MAFRTVIVKSRAKLELRLNTLVIRGDVEKKVFINEINTLIIQSTAVSITTSLLSYLINNNVKVIFCDEKCNPSSELVAYYGAHNTSKKYKIQFNWSNNIKGDVWSCIIREKIIAQALHLKDCGFLHQSEMLLNYSNSVEFNDVTNREGHAAKVYFNCILGENVSRNSGGFINGCLNYGYAVLLSAFNREIVASGYLTQLGIWHDNEFNEFNLACDLMEPYRVIIDRLALSLPLNDVDFKKKMANVLNFQTEIGDKHTTLDLAIRQYVKSVLVALETERLDKITFIKSVTIKNEL